MRAGRSSSPTFDSALGARRITEDAIDFIDEQYIDRGPVRGRRRDRRRARRRRRPFLAVLSHLAPHAPYRVEPRFAGRSDAGLYGDAVEQLDHHLSTLVRHLGRRGETARTLVILTSDNGPHYEGRTGRRRGRKPEVFDGGVLVPFVASWLTAGRARRDSTPRSLLDLTPSLCALAGVTPPGDLDGEDMSRLLLGRDTPARRPVFLFWGERLFAMRSGRWKLHVAGVSNPGLATVFAEYWPQLYDVEADYREEYTVENLHPEVVARLRPQLEAVAADVAAEAAARAKRTAP